MDAFSETSIRYHTSEYVCVLLEKQGSVTGSDLNRIRGVGRVPGKLRHCGLLDFLHEIWTLTFYSRDGPQRCRDYAQVVTIIIKGEFRVDPHHRYPRSLLTRFPFLLMIG